MKNKRKYFGTDGIRGKANSNKMNASLALKIGMATAEYFTDIGGYNDEVTYVQTKEGVYVCIFLNN